MVSLEAQLRSSFTGPFCLYMRNGNILLPIKVKANVYTLKIFGNINFNQKVAFPESLLSRAKLKCYILFTCSGLHTEVTIDKTLNQSTIAKRWHQTFQVFSTNLADQLESPMHLYFRLPLTIF